MNLIQIVLFIVEVQMEKKYEYKFERIGKGFLVFKSEAERTYQNVIAEYAENGWRLVQIFSPSLGIWVLSRYFDSFLKGKNNENYNYFFGLFINRPCSANSYGL